MAASNERPYAAVDASLGNEGQDYPSVINKEYNIENISAAVTTVKTIFRRGTDVL